MLIFRKVVPRYDNFSHTLFPDLKDFRMQNYSTNMVILMINQIGEGI